MNRTCCTCGCNHHLYLHRGKLFCYRCVPVDELLLVNRAHWAMRCSVEARAEAQVTMDKLRRPS